MTFIIERCPYRTTDEQRYCRQHAEDLRTSPDRNCTQEAGTDNHLTSDLSSNLRI